MKIRALIVDDEQWSRARVAQMLEKHSDVEIAGFASDGDEALLLASKADLIFLDVAMPSLDGLAVVARLPRATRPVVVFMSAWQQHAASAFEADAVDYLLKPFDAERFDRALQKARTQLAMRAASTERRTRYRERFAVPTRERIVIVPVSAVESIEAEGSYVRLYTAKASYLVRESMRQLEAALDPAAFLRVHRSAIVSIERVRHATVDAHGKLRLELASGRAVPVGRLYDASVRAILGLTGGQAP